MFCCFGTLLSASAHSFIVNKRSQRPASSLFKVFRSGESKKCTELFVSIEIFFDLYIFLKKFSSSASICFAFRMIKPSSFFNAVICFFLWFLFSKLRKYLLFFSPNSYQRALLRTIVPWVFLAITLASLLFKRSISAFFASSKVERICSCRQLNFSNNFLSSLRFSLAFLLGPVYKEAG